MSGVLLCLVMILFRAHRALSWMVFVSAGLVLLLGLLITIKLVLFERGLEVRLERLATLARAREEVEKIESSVIDHQLSGALEERIQERVPAEDPKPDSRLARVLRDDYPL